jgi:uncharacterized HAD superfamily protein
MGRIKNKADLAKLRYRWGTQNIDGDILSLTGSDRNTTLGKIDTVSTLASNRNIDFNIDQDITTAINVAKNVGVAVFETVTGKRLYPKTESVKVPSSNTG